MALLHILARSNPNNVAMAPAQKIVLGVNLVFGVGLMLLASMSKYDAHDQFATTPWIIPSICLVFFFSLVIIHGARWIPIWTGERGRNEAVVEAGALVVEKPSGDGKATEVRATETSA